ncbi:MAG TPA: cytoplasmic filament protein CfpA [bacterium]|nr:cytoplasmic filament protein CfpA [bacterium]
MASDDIITHGPNVVHPEIPSAVGSRNSLNRHSRDEYSEARVLVDEEVDKILNHLHAKLPPEVSNRLEVMGGIKGKLHTYYSQNLQNMLNRYLTTVEDEMGKKVRDLVDMEELRGLNRYTPRSISYLLDRIGGSDKFNSGEVEKSIVNMFGHLQGHVQREMNDLETHTNSLLRRKTDVGAFVRGENAYSITKCSFRDHPDKPHNVFELKLALNIDESELISAVFPYHTAAIDLLKDMMTRRIYEAIDREIEKINMDLVDEGKAEMSPEEKIFERVRLLDNYVSDEDTEGSRRFSLIAKKFMDALGDVTAEISSEEYDALGVRENVFRIIENDNIRNRGWNTAINAITHILDWSRMSYQHIENYKSSRHAVIREYEATDPKRLPDERYKMELVGYSTPQLGALREAYATQLSELDRTVNEVWQVVEEIYQENLRETGRDDWDSFSSKVLGGKVQERRRSWSWFAAPEEGGEGDVQEVKARQWNEITFIAPPEGQAIQENPTLETRIRELKARFPIMFRKLESVFEEKNPTLRQIVENRVEFLQGEFSRFSAQVNPYHIQPGILLDVDIVTIKRKSTTMMNMANVLNEFLYQVSKGFQDTAFAEFSRRRSTQRMDVEGEFMTGVGVADVSGTASSEEVFE